MTQHRFIALIPARYASTRFPGKPLARLGGITVVQRVYEQVRSTIDSVYVCTDDERICQEVERFGGRVVMTSPDHRSGTDRCHEAYAKVGGDADVVINVQGDEPFVHPCQLRSLMACFEDPSTDIATLVKPFDPAAGLEALQNPNTPKVVVGTDMQALYFSRSVVPYLRGADPAEWLGRHTYYKHIGLYAYRAQVLERITRLPQGKLEMAESLEQLRWLENGFRIRVAQTDVETIGIDTPADLARAEAYLKTIKPL